MPVRCDVPDQNAFEELLNGYDAALRRIARMYAETSGEDEDLYQDILLQLWRSLPSFRGEAALGTWLYRVALNTALTWRRKSDRRLAFEALPNTDVSDRGSASSPRTEAAILAEFLGSLGGLDRAVLVLYMEGLSHVQMAEVTGSTPAAIGVRLHRLRRAFETRYIEG